MKYTAFMNNKALGMNVQELLKKYDKDGDGFTKDEFTEFVKGSVSVFAKPLASELSNKAMKKLDSNKDDFISNQELEDIALSYGLKYEDALKMNVRDLVEHINKVNDERKNNRTA